jgi:hypothetical protein
MKQLAMVVTLASAMALAQQKQQQQPQSGAEVEPKADQILRKMSDFLAAQKTFNVTTEHNTEVVLDSGQKLDFLAGSNLTVQRPNKLRSDRTGEMADLALFYDGKSVTLYAKRMNLYATAPAPGNLDEAIDFTRQKLDLDAPAADLLYAKPYDVLMEDVVSGKYIATAIIDGKLCHHLAYRGNETDWQIWVEDGARPLPRRFTITSKKVKGTPDYTVELTKWDLNPKITPDLFVFTPPPKAERIEFAGLRAQKESRR